MGVPRFWSGSLTSADIAGRDPTTGLGGINGGDLSQNAAVKLLVVLLPDLGTLGTIPTTGNVTATVRTPCTGFLAGIVFWSNGYTQDNTNFVTFDVTDLGTAGSGTTVMTATTPSGVNTTRPVANGGMGTLAANAVGTLFPVTGGAPCTSGNILRVRATVTLTLGAAITGSHIGLSFLPTT